MFCCAILSNRVLIEIHPVEGKYSVFQKSEFMRRATDAAVEALGCSSEEVVIRIHEIRAENIGRGGVPFSRRG